MQPEIVNYSRVDALALARNKVLRNTYLLLALSLVPTVVGAYVGTHLDFSFMAGHPLLYTLGMFAVVMGLGWGIAANRNSGLGVALLLAMTLFLGVMLGPILQVALRFANGPQLIALAAGGTSVIFFALAGLATVTKKDFSFLGKFLFIGLILLLVAMVANAFLHIPALALTLSVIAILIFSGYLLFDVSRVVNGGETNYVMATLAIYLDIYNIFVNLLYLLMALAGNNRN